MAEDVSIPDADFAQSVCYTYGTDGRMDTITVTNAQGRSVSVVYDWEQGRLAGCTVFSAAGSPLFIRTQTRALRRPALVTAVTNAGVQPLTSNLSPLTFSYAYDAVGRPVTRDADAFGYNARGEVVSATVGTNAATYAYDGIGNRLTSVDTHGARAYAANALNEYAFAGTDVPDYDEDGNLILSGGRQYAWDAENRLVSVGPADPQTGDLRSEFSYDWQSRRVGKTSWIRTGNTWQLIETRVFVYDDWNLFREIRSDAATGSSTEIDYFWGSDLSGTLQGAGGVGGLVAVSIGGQFYFPCYDQNGNVTAYCNETGSLVAEYVYDAFGNAISSSESMASVFSHRFSTKYYDSEPDLYYYGYRYYSPSLGRWISRDPMEEMGGIPLYGFVFNSSLSFVDNLGRFSLSALVASILGAVGIEYDLLNFPTMMNDAIISSYGGADSFMDATERDLRAKGGVVSEELFKKSRRRNTNPININSTGVEKKLYKDLQKTIKQSALYKEKKQFIIKRLKEGTLYNGFVNIEFKADEDPKAAYSIGGAQLHYSYDPKTKKVSFWIEDTYDFRKKGHVWERLFDLGYIDYFDETIEVESVKCTPVAPEVAPDE